MLSNSNNHKPFRKYALIAAILIVGAGASGGALYTYGSGQNLPAHWQVAGWNAGGMSYAAFQQQLEQRWKHLSSLQVELQSTNPEVAAKQLSLEQLGIVLHREELDAALQELFQGSVASRIAARWTLRNAELPLSVSIDASKLQAATQQAWKEVYDRQPTAARRIVNPDDSIQIEPDRSVPRIDLATLKKQLEASIPAIYVEQKEQQPLKLTIPLYDQPASVTVDSLSKQGIERKIVEFTTNFPVSGEGRIHNIRSTAATMHDLLLAPGDVFDYSKMIEQTEAHYGYKEAPVILDGKLVPGIGGGICQVSSTLYNAVLRSGLQIVERRNHSLPVSYVPLGQDATFASGYINFKFRNNTDAYLLIRTVTSDRAVTVKLFGQMPSSVSYDVESKVIETIQPPVKYVFNPSLRRGTTKSIKSGKAGYVVETYRYKKQGGVIVGKELISKDRYSPVPALMASNTGDPKKEDGKPAEPHNPLLEDGVKGPTFR